MADYERGEDVIRRVAVVERTRVHPLNTWQASARSVFSLQVLDESFRGLRVGVPGRVSLLQHPVTDDKAGSGNGATEWMHGKLKVAKVESPFRHWLFDGSPGPFDHRDFLAIGADSKDSMAMMVRSKPIAAHNLVLESLDLF